MKIRRATFGDLPHIIDIYAMDGLTGSREIVSNDVPEIYKKAFIEIDGDPMQILLVADKDGIVIGTIQVTSIQHLISNSFKRAVIEALFIDKTYQGMGVGAFLVEAAEDWARRNGCVSLELTSNKQKLAAHKFYQKMKFTGSHEGFKKKLA